MLVALSRSASEVAFKAVATVEEFTDIHADVVDERKLAAWVEDDERLNIENAFIDYDVLASGCDRIFKFLDSHTLLDFREGIFLAKSSPVHDFKYYQDTKDHDKVGQVQGRSKACFLAVHVEVQVNAREDCNLANS